MPALATTTSMPPKRSTAWVATACMAGRSRTSATPVSTRSSPISAASAVSSALSRSVSTSLAPLVCSRRATSAPIPRAPPVMKTTLSCSDVMTDNVPPRTQPEKLWPVFVHRLGESIIVGERGQSEGLFDGAQQAVVVVVVIGNEMALAHPGIRRRDHDHRDVIALVAVAERQVVVILVPSYEYGGSLRLECGRVQNRGQRVRKKLVAGPEVVLMQRELADDEAEVVAPFLVVAFVRGEPHVIRGGRGRSEVGGHSFQ